MSLMRLERWLLQSPGVRSAKFSVATSPVRGSPVNRIAVELYEGDQVRTSNASILAETSLGRALDLVETNE